MTLAHWDDVEPEVRDVGEMRATFRALGGGGGRERGRRGAHRHRARLPPRARCTSTPPRRRSSSCSRARASRGSTAPSTRSAPATRSSTSPGGPLHTVIAGDDGLSVLAYGENHAPAARAPAARGHGPPRRDLARGLPRRPARARGRRRPARAARAHAAPAVQRRAGGRRARDRPGRRGRHQPSATSPAPPARCAAGLRHVVVAPGALNCPPHWHAAEHELFVVLDGGGHAAALRQPGRRSPRSTRCAPATACRARRACAWPTPCAPASRA